MNSIPMLRCAFTPKNVHYITTMLNMYIIIQLIISSYINNAYAENLDDVTMIVSYKTRDLSETYLYKMRIRIIGKRIFQDLISFKSSESMKNFAKINEGYSYIIGETIDPSKDRLNRNKWVMKNSKFVNPELYASINNNRIKLYKTYRQIYDDGGKDITTDNSYTRYVIKFRSGKCWLTELVDRKSSVTRRKKDGKKIYYYTSNPRMMGSTCQVLD